MCYRQRERSGNDPSLSLQMNPAPRSAQKPAARGRPSGEGPRAIPLLRFHVQQAFGHGSSSAAFSPQDSLPLSFPFGTVRSPRPQQAPGDRGARAEQPGDFAASREARPGRAAGPAGRWRCAAPFGPSGARAGASGDARSSKFLGPFPDPHECLWPSVASSLRLRDSSWPCFQALDVNRCPMLLFFFRVKSGFASVLKPILTAQAS